MRHQNLWYDKRVYQQRNTFSVFQSNEKFRDKKLKNSKLI